MLINFKPYLSGLSIALVVVLIAWAGFGSAKADTVFTANAPSNYGLVQALAAPDSYGLYSGKSDNGLKLSTGFFSGLASGAQTTPVYSGSSKTSNLNFNHGSAQLFGDANVYALLVDGHYDFNYDDTSNASLHPYLSGGAGMAMYGQAYGASAATLQNGQMVPLARFGGGVAYKMSDKLNLSVDYNAGVSGRSDLITTGHSAQMIDTQIVNMGMHLSF